MLNGFLTLTRCLNVALLHTTTEGGGGKELSTSIQHIYDGQRVHLGRGSGGGGAKKRSEDGPRIEIQPLVKRRKRGRFMWLKDATCRGFS
jgi:hypothetical protein